MIVEVGQWGWASGTGFIFKILFQEVTLRLLQSRTLQFYQGNYACDLYAVVN